MYHINFIINYYFLTTWAVLDNSPNLIDTIFRRDSIGRRYNIPLWFCQTLQWQVHSPFGPIMARIPNLYVSISVMLVFLSLGSIPLAEWLQMEQTTCNLNIWHKRFYDYFWARGVLEQGCYDSGRKILLVFILKNILRYSLRRSRRINGNFGKKKKARLSWW